MAIVTGTEAKAHQVKPSRCFMGFFSTKRSILTRKQYQLFKVKVLLNQSRNLHLNSSILSLSPHPPRQMTCLTEISQALIEVFQPQ